MRPRRRHRWWVLPLLGLLGGCATPDNPYKIPPMLAGTVRLDAALSDATGVPTGTRVTITADGVRVWLTEAGVPVDSVLTRNGGYLLFAKHGHTYRVRAGIPPGFADSSAAITTVRDIGYYPDTLRLGRVGDLVSSPNPFNTQVRVLFRLAADTPMELTVHDLAARRVRLLASGLLPAGLHLVLWDGKDDAANVVPDGMYWVLFRSASETRAELVIKGP